MADIARIEDRIDRVAASTLEVSDALGGLRFQNMVEVMEFAKCMAVADTAVPKHLRGNPGMCLAVCIQALEWRFSPFAVANKSYVVNDRIGYESQLVHAVIEQRAPIIGRLRHKFDGEGDDRRCTVSATLRETGESLEYISPPFSKIQPKNSPLWKTKPDLQLYYNTSRDFCRAYFPDVLLGVYSQEELRDHVGPDNAKDVSKPDVASRLKAKGARGFNHSHVERESRGGVVDQTEAQREAGNKQSPPASTADEALASDQGSSADDSGEVQDRSESTSPPNSNSVEPSAPQAQAQPDGPADPVVPPPESAGDLSQSSVPPVDEEAQASDASPAGLPSGWGIAYAGALRRAQKPESLKKYAAQWWSQYGGFDAHKNGPDGPTAVAIYDAFTANFGRPELIEAALRELI